jgi:hypothetical protein
MSNKFKVKKAKVKSESTAENKAMGEQKNSAKFMKNKREKGTISSNFSGKSSKEFSRKKT